MHRAAGRGKAVRKEVSQAARGMEGEGGSERGMLELEFLREGIKSGRDWERVGGWGS